MKTLVMGEKLQETKCSYAMISDEAEKATTIALETYIGTGRHIRKRNTPRISISIEGNKVFDGDKDILKELLKEFQVLIIGGKNGVISFVRAVKTSTYEEALKLIEKTNVSFGDEFCYASIIDDGVDYIVGENLIIEKSKIS